MLGPLSANDAAYIAVVLCMAWVAWLYKHILKGWLHSLQLWFLKPALDGLAAHEAKSGPEDDERRLDNIEERDNLQDRRIERLEEQG